MTRLRLRPLIPVLALIALNFLAPTLALAMPRGESVLSAAGRPETAAGLFSKVWSLLSALWAENGSALEPNGTPDGASSGADAEPGAAGSGDNGSGLDPNG